MSLNLPIRVFTVKPASRGQPVVHSQASLNDKLAAQERLKCSPNLKSPYSIQFPLKQCTNLPYREIGHLFFTPQRFHNLSCMGTAYLRTCDLNEVHKNALLSCFCSVISFCLHTEHVCCLNINMEIHAQYQPGTEPSQLSPKRTSLLQS